MKTRWVLLLLACAGIVWTSGCVTSVDGRRHVGVPLIKDSVESQYERSVREIWTASKDVIAFNGQLTGEDLLKSTLEGAVNSRKVWIKIEPIDKGLTRVIVQTRTKSGTADLELAGELDKQIAIRLATGNLTPATKPIRR